MCAISQLLQYWCFLSQVVIRVAQINWVTHHGNTQLIVEPADRGRGAKRKAEFYNQEKLMTWKHKLQSFQLKKKTKNLKILPMACHHSSLSFNSIGISSTFCHLSTWNGANVNVNSPPLLGGEFALSPPFNLLRWKRGLQWPEGTFEKKVSVPLANSGVEEWGFIAWVGSYKQHKVTLLDAGDARVQQVVGA